MQEAYTRHVIYYADYVTKIIVSSIVGSAQLMLNRMVHLMYNRYEGEAHGLQTGLCFPKGNVDTGKTNVGHCPQFVINKASAGNKWNVLLFFISASRPCSASWAHLPCSVSLKMTLIS